jgi:hypothetical protein
MKLSTLSLSPPVVSPPVDEAPSAEESSSSVSAEEIVIPTDIAAAEPQENNQRLSIPSLTRPRSNSRPEARRTTTGDDDIYALDDEGWSRVANAQGIEEMVRLGEGVSGSVSKCRLRKSGQIFAIKVLVPIL